MFGRATITLGIGPHSSSFLNFFLASVFCFNIVVDLANYLPSNVDIVISLT